MEIYVEGIGKDKLTKQHYVTSGGEGAIYVKKNTAYKIYQKDSHMIAREKINELSRISDSHIIKPERIILDKNDKPIGYTMNYINDTISLCQLFTKAFKIRNNIQVNNIVKLVEQFRNSIQHCHDNKILLVDVNELNFLVNNTKFDNIYFIDVDSYQTQNYPATAIMDSIRDRHANGTWSEKTDWFSFGIITFQMFIGMHPYKGKHSQYKSLDDRMINNISVFNKDVRTPPAALPITNIPPSFRNWYKAIFEDGKRIGPPIGDVTIIIMAPVIKIIKGNNNFQIEMYKEYEGDIISYDSGIALTTKGLYTNGKYTDNIASYAHIVRLPKYSIYISAIIKDHKLQLVDINQNRYINSNIMGESLFSYDDRLYVKNDDSIYEVNIMFIKDRPIVSLHTVCNIYPKATQVFDGIAIQNLFGSYFISVFPKSKEHYQVKIDELKGYRIVNAKFERGVAVAVGEKKGTYDKFIIKFNDDYSQYSTRKEEGVLNVDINFTALDNGIVVYENKEGYVELFFNKYSSNDLKVIQDNTLSGGRFTQMGNQMLLIKGNKIYKINMN